MKRTALKRKTPLRRAGFMKRRQVALRAISRNPVPTAKRKAWTWFSRYIRLRDAQRTMQSKALLRCCTCGRIVRVTGKGCAQAGHWKPGRHRGILFEERAVHGQCVHCNKWLHGNEERYTEFMLRTYGPQDTERLRIKASSRSHSWSVWELRLIEEEYKAKVEKMGGWPPQEKTQICVDNVMTKEV